MAKSVHITSNAQAHALLIDELIEEFPSVQRNGLFAALRNLPDAPYFTDLLANEKEWVEKTRFIPDAWVIDEAERTIILFEIVVTNDISECKIGKIVELAWALDEDYWSVCLFRCDLAGRQAYHPLGAYITYAGDKIGAGDGSPKSTQIPHWMRYTAEHCAERLKGAA